MKIVVCVKIVDGALNPFDACALECALQLGGTVTVVSMGPQSAAAPLRELTRLGAVRVLLLCDGLYAGSDTLATSYILSKAIEPLHPDLVLCGRQSIDGDTAQVGAELAQRLGLALISNVLTLRAEQSAVRCKTRMGDASAALPALLTIERINTLRFPGLRSKLGEIEVWDNSRVGADPARCGLAGSPTKVLKSFQSERGRRHCKFITWEELRPLVQKRRAGTPRQITYQQAEKRLPCICVIGNALLEIGKTVAEEVEVLPRGTAEELCRQITDRKVPVVLWPADLWGRQTAPRVAAMLETGLCADCTALETDGERLYMYRPARGGSVTAKIACAANPQMATVRLPGTQEHDVLVAGGRGVSGCYERFLQLVQELDGVPAAGRSLVDAGLAPYEQQVGLTGKTVCPPVYVAVGLSGAVQHTCAIENAGTVIAINPDRHARIFEYADYGIVSAL